MKKGQLLRFFLKAFFLLLLEFFEFILLIILISNLLVEFKTNSQVFSDVRLIPPNETGLLLGTSKYRYPGGANLFYQRRINAAMLLFNHGKIGKLIISGDNSHISYNEPRDMRLDLIRQGFPAEKIYLDFAGFRTLDSVVRCKKIFQQDKITIISQSFHNKRAIYIALAKNIDAIGFCAGDVRGIDAVKVSIREMFARVKLIMDIHFFNTQPRFLGDKINIQS